MMILNAAFTDYRKAQASHNIIIYLDYIKEYCQQYFASYPTVIGT